MCHFLGAPLPDACGVTSEHDRAARGIASLSVFHLLPSAFFVGSGPDPTNYGRGFSPDNARAWELTRWAQIQKVAQGFAMYTCPSGATIVAFEFRKVP